MPVGEVANGTVYFVHTEHLGTPQVIIDATQAVVWGNV
jgi:uncharacterized protein RhaS with RHS repeats